MCDGSIDRHGRHDTWRGAMDNRVIRNPLPFTPFNGSRETLL
jgi:hypothetical protein